MEQDDFLSRFRNRFTRRNQQRAEDERYAKQMRKESERNEKAKLEQEQREYERKLKAWSDALSRELKPYVDDVNRPILGMLEILGEENHPGGFQLKRPREDAWWLVTDHTRRRESIREQVPTGRSGNKVTVTTGNAMVERIWGYEVALNKTIHGKMENGDTPAVEVHGFIVKSMGSRYVPYDLDALQDALFEVSRPTTLFEREWARRHQSHGYE